MRVWQTLVAQRGCGRHSWTRCLLECVTTCVKLKAVYCMVFILPLQMSDQMFDAIDNILKAPVNNLQSSHEQFNTSGR